MNKAGYGSGALLVRDGGLLKQAHRGEADYLQDTMASLDQDSPADLSPELTKHFRGLRMWLPLQVLGLAPFRAALSEKLLLARYFHAQMAASDLFEAGSIPRFRFCMSLPAKFERTVGRDPGFCHPI